MLQDSTLILIYINFFLPRVFCEISSLSQWMEKKKLQRYDVLQVPLTWFQMADNLQRQENTGAGYWKQ